MTPDTKTFRSRVARRLFLVFALCALAPMLTFALYSYSRVGSQLEADAVTSLAGQTKATGISIYERLAIAQSQLQLLAANPADSTALEASANSAFISWGTTTAAASSLNEDQKEQLSLPGSVLLRFEPDGDAWILRLFLATTRELIQGELDPDFVFTPERREFGDRYWVEGHDGELLFVSADDENTRSVLAAGPNRISRSAFSLQGPEGAELGIVWPLFLDVPYRAREIRVGVSRTEAQIYRPLVEFEQTFPMVVLLSLVVAVGLALRQVRRTLVPLEALTQATQSMSEGHYDHRVAIETRDEFRDLGHAFNEMASEIQGRIESLNRLHEIGRSLSSEEGVDNVLEKIVKGAATLSAAQSCALFLVDDDDIEESRALHVADSWEADRIGVDARREVRYPSCEANSACELGVAVRVAAGDERTSQQIAEWSQFEDSQPFEIRALLAVPLRAPGGDVLGALVVIRNASDDEGFAEEELDVVQSLASQAAIAIRQARSVESLRALFEGLIQLTVRAIDEKSPYTGDHCRKVPILTELIAEAVGQATEGPLKNLRLSEEERYELRIAALLHDCGKMVTPVNIMDKATKLEKISDRIELVRLRAEIIRKDRSLQIQTDDGADQREFDVVLCDDIEFIERCNIGGEFMSESARQRVAEIQARYTWQDRDGNPQPLLSDSEVSNLQIQKGTLNREEREVIKQHVTTTIKLLEELPFPRELRNVPSIAGAHHEMVNGCGYPQGLGGSDLTIQARILGLADVFEALTAKDRPYKPGMSLSKSLQILGMMVEEGHLDKSLYDLFVDERIYLSYAAEQMDPSQIDGEHLAALEEMTEPWR